MLLLAGQETLRHSSVKESHQQVRFKEPNMGTSYTSVAVLNLWNDSPPARQPRLAPPRLPCNPDVPLIRMWQTTVKRESPIQKSYGDLQALC